MVCFNKRVIDNYLSGLDINDALNSEFETEITERKSENELFHAMSPFQMAMYDAGISKYSNMGKIMDTALYTTGGLDNNQWLFPVWLETTLREALYGQDILPYIVGETYNVDGNVIQSATLDLKSEKNLKGIRQARIAEAADIPVGKIQIGERAITLWKHGKALEMTYESVRRMRIDLFAKFMNAVAGDLAFQHLALATETLAKGDGNENSESTEIGETETAGKITAQELSSFCFNYWYENHFSVNTIIAPVEIAKQIAAMTFDTSLSTGAGPTLQFTMPQFGNQNITLLAADVPQIDDSDVILLMNKQNTLARYAENGSTIQENQNFARNQTNLLTFTENSGFAIGVLGSNMHIKIKA